MAGLTTHVLDTALGRPAEGVRIELFELSGGARKRIAMAETNANGRTDVPLISPQDARAGKFELAFHVGAYFRQHAIPVADPPFLDVVPIRFSIADPEAHYHVPLVVAPWGYSTYRGS